MNVLFAASEAVPFLKTGGLADVIGALPKELKKQGVKAQVILPKYENIPEQFKEKMIHKTSITVPVGWREQFCGIEYLEHEGITFYFIDNEYYFKRGDGVYGFYDDGERYAYFCRAVLEALPHLNEKPDIIHCHDWQTGMISVLMKAHYRNHPDYQGIKTMFTVHNLRYQGVFPKEILHDLLDLSELYFHADGLEFHGNVSFMKAGLVYSDIITTVSPTYAEEIKMPYYGENLDGLLRKRSHELHGIVNGVDYDLYSPETDANLFSNYTKYSYEEKLVNKCALQERIGLPVDETKPMVALITRLTDQKGIDLILYVLHEILELDLQFVVLGTGEKEYEDRLKEAAWHHADKCSAQIYFDEGLARKLYAASDLFLMPSQFEPCGISQLLALRYGSLPIVRETGGLKDTVQPYNKYTNEGVGFSFANYNAHDMLYTIEQAVALYHEDKAAWSDLVWRAMNKDFSWKSSSEKYKKLYDSLLK
ncbi:glycogen synthase GlgA [Bacillus taeanensis]|uniref:Glycogen synthase n=1 Tax=Bacillus taeanensis TaxID=273032 RepID=A0A366Y1W5_9BACI|nr:glycogen synthase GlgA [Bacillus taeanensis]RBW71375.1 glycogen synthase GlgA [Bacillus taeanensis]